MDGRRHVEGFGGKGRRTDDVFLILIPTFKICVFLYSRQTDRQMDKQTDRQTEKLIQGGLDNLIGSSRFMLHLLLVGWRNYFGCALVSDFWLWGEIVFGFTSRST